MLVHFDLPPSILALVAYCCCFPSAWSKPGSCFGCPPFTFGLYISIYGWMHVCLCVCVRAGVKSGNPEISQDMSLRCNHRILSALQLALLKGAAPV